MHDKGIDLVLEAVGNQRISEIKKELLRQPLDSQKNFSYSLTFFSPETKALSSEPLQVISAAVSVC